MKQSTPNSCHGEAIVRSRASRVTHRSPRAFTLIELMVVIGIIGVLIAIALPAFSAVRNRAKKVSTEQMISTLSLGIESFRTDSKTQGTLPQSVNPDNSVRNPHVQDTGAVINDSFGGANLLAWTLLGADFLGTPGFKDLNGSGTTSDAFGGWCDDVGQNPSYAPASPPTQPQLYDLDLTGKPIFSRNESKFVDIAKLKLPTIQDKGKSSVYFELSDLKSKPRLGSICFLDAWGSPILYYKANRSAPLMVDAGSGLSGTPSPADYNHPTGTYVPTGVYNLRDNLAYTGFVDSGGSAVLPGMDLGAGTEHPMGKLGPYHKSVSGVPAPVEPTEADRGTFAYMLWNKSVTTAPRAYNDDSYILISPGVDGRWGTGDDVSNIPNNLSQ